MRPVRRGASPNAAGFVPYESARDPLIGRIGRYCSYCERPLLTQLAVEHLQPKGLAVYAHLESEWTNFLLACVNCNSCKGEKDVDFNTLYFPDRDNTFYAFQYLADGTVIPRPGLTPVQSSIAVQTLELMNLNKDVRVAEDENGAEIAMDRKTQRMEAWGTADTALGWWQANPSREMHEAILGMAKLSGFFSIWMEVFAGCDDLRQALVNTIPGTATSGCFLPPDAAVVSPHPNGDALHLGGKI